MGLMSLIGLNTKVQFIKRDNTVIEFEASLNEVHSRQSTPTEFPIENGKVINDHVILKPIDLELNMIVTDNPIGGMKALLTEAATTLTSKLLPPIGTVALGAGMGGLALYNSIIKKTDSPSVHTYIQLMKMQEMGDPFTCLTSLFRYKDMVISSISVPREAQNGKCLLITIGLRQLTIVKAKNVHISAMANPGLADSLHKMGQQGTGSDRFVEGYKDLYKQVD